MKKLIVSEWVTLDGVFDADSMKLWFNPYDSAERQACIKELVLSSDAFLFGRVTYQMLAGYWPNVKADDPEFTVANRLNTAPKYVVSTTLEKGEWQNSTIVKDNVVEEVTKLKQQSGQNLLVFGSATLVQALMAADLVDEYRLLVHPVFMGGGKRAFKDGMATTKLTLAKNDTFTFGVSSLCYVPVRA
jgi:dihydrofolate reductase